MNPSPHAGAGKLLVSIRKSGPLRPLFLVHSLAGELTWLPPLAQRLGARQPLFGFAAPGLNAREPFFDSLEAMAAAYLAAARSVTNGGGRVFGGYSFGGVIAFEMARQALQGGEPVAGLVLVDAYSPLSPVMRALEGWSRNGLLLQSVANLLGLEWKAAELLAPGSLPEDDPMEQCEMATRHLLRHCNVPHSHEALRSLLEKCVQVMQVHTRMLAGYQPPPLPVEIPCLLLHNTQGFVGPDSPLNLPRIEGQDDDGWQGRLPASARHRGIATEHFLMMRSPAIEAVADAIREFMEGLQA